MRGTTRAVVVCAMLLSALTAAAATLRFSAGSSTVPARTAVRSGRVVQYWPDGLMKSDVTYRNDAYEGEYRTWHANGQPFEWRHYVNGREEGIQQSWTDAGVLYLNYEVRDGRRFGLVNASPCEPVHGATSPPKDGGAPREPATTAATMQPDHAAPAARTSTLPFYDEATFTPRWRPVDHRVGDFSLTTQTGAGISGEALRGRPYVASFIYTQCAAICPLLVRQLSRVQRAGGARIVSFSVAPEVDTLEQLARFGQENGVDPERWSLVTGDKATIYRLARDGYFADDSRLDVQDPAAFLHTEKLVLVDAEGRLRGIYNGTQPHAVDQLIADLATLTDL